MRFYLNCPYNEKEEAKSYGAKWDKDAKKWYYIADVPDSRFNKWQEPVPEPPDTSGYFFHNEQVNIYSEEELRVHSEYVMKMRTLFMNAPENEAEQSEETKEAMRYMRDTDKFDTAYEEFLFSSGYEGIPSTYQSAKTGIPCIDNLKYKDDINFCFGTEGNQFTGFKFCAASYAKNGDLFINAIGFMKLDGMKEPPKNISSLIATQAGSNVAFVMGYQGEQLGLLVDAKINLRDLQEIENLSFDKGREQPKDIER